MNRAAGIRIFAMFGAAIFAAGEDVCTLAAVHAPIGAGARRCPAA